DECPKNIRSNVAKNLKKLSQAPRGVSVGPKVGFKPVKQIYRHISKKSNANTSCNKKKDVESRKKISNLNSFDVLNSVENDVDLVLDRTNPLTQIVHGRKLSYLGPGGLTARTATFPIRDIHPSHYERICPIDTSEGISVGLIGSLAIHAKIGRWGSLESPFYKISERSKGTRMLYLSPGKDEYYMIAAGNSLENVDYPGDHDSDDEVKLVDSEMASFLASKRVDYGTNRLLEYWKKTYENAHYDYDPYGDDMYES
nr:RNA polymerase beta subunit, chloroplastic [Tanacetum cinerariifolium]